MPRCTAKSKRSGERCRRHAAPGASVCHMHGAGGGRPLAHGRYSKFLPVRLAADYAAALQDPDLADLEGEIGVVQALVYEAARELDEQSGAHLWGLIGQGCDRLERAIADDDADAAIAALAALRNTVARGRSAADKEARLLRLIARKESLALSQAKRLAAAEHSLSAKEANALVAALLASVREVIRDRTQLAAVQKAFVRLCGPTDRDRPA
ncbi:MAG: hypothetical protein KIS66_02550 [Fimbriimonadaceae bacterium]|nr:hypothetical protein [Fimbriimonadaceae bacterium]